MYCNVSTNSSTEQMVALICPANKNCGQTKNYHEVLATLNQCTQPGEPSGVALSCVGDWATPKVVNDPKRYWSEAVIIQVTDNHGDVGNFANHTPAYHYVKGKKHKQPWGGTA